MTTQPDDQTIWISLCVDEWATVRAALGIVRRLTLEKQSDYSDLPQECWRLDRKIEAQIMDRLCSPAAREAPPL
ncbi:MAG: hypothetical protein ACK5JM_09145 [Rhodoblastus sp.]